MLIGVVTAPELTCHWQPWHRTSEYGSCQVQLLRGTTRDNVERALDSDVQSLRTDEAVGGQHEESLLCFKVTETNQIEARCIFLATYLISNGEQNNSVYLH